MQVNCTVAGGATKIVLLCSSTPQGALLGLLDAAALQQFDSIRNAVGGVQSHHVAPAQLMAYVSVCRQSLGVPVTLLTYHVAQALCAGQLGHHTCPYCVTV